MNQKQGVVPFSSDFGQGWIFSLEVKQISIENSFLEEEDNETASKKNSMDIQDSMDFSHHLTKVCRWRREI